MTQDEWAYYGRHLAEVKSAEVVDILTDLRASCLVDGLDFNELVRLSGNRFARQQAEKGATCPHIVITPERDAGTRHGSQWCPRCCVSVHYGTEVR